MPHERIARPLDHMKPPHFLAMIAAAAVLYVFSVGPAHWLFVHNLISHQTLLTIYHPLFESPAPIPEMIAEYSALWMTGKDDALSH